jgi:hypothetical protein
MFAQSRKPFRFLFVRPEWAKLDRKRAPALQPAE